MRWFQGFHQVVEVQVKPGHHAIPIKGYFALATAALMAIAVSAFPSDATAAICKVLRNDIGTIVGKGPDKSSAFEDAALQCYERYEAQHKRLYKDRELDLEKGLDLIDTCANIRCS